MNFFQEKDYEAIANNHVLLVKKWMEGNHTKIVEDSIECLLDIITTTKNRWFTKISEETQERLNKLLQ